MSKLTEGEALEYTEACAQVQAGSWRQIMLAGRIGVPGALGLTTREWVEEKLGGYIRLAIPERKEAALELTAEGMSTREIGDVLGVSHETAAADVRNLTDGDGDEAESVNNLTPHVARATGQNEWYTPAEYIAAAVEVLGDIDLDPASSAEANTVVKAKHFFSWEDDGLAYEWAGRIWMNPPFAAGLIEKFIEKLVWHFEAGAVSEAIVLVNNATETDWFRELAQRARVGCFPYHRVRFSSPNGEAGAPLQGQAVLYLGPHVAAFARAYAELGWIFYPKRILDDALLYGRDGRVLCC